MLPQYKHVKHQFKATPMYKHIYEIISKYNQQEKQIKKNIKALEKRLIEETENFLKKKEYINERSGVSRDTLLHLAFRNFLVDYAKYLLSRGALINLRNQDGKTPADLVDLEVQSSPSKLALNLFRERSEKLKQLFYEHVKKKGSQEKRFLRLTMLLDEGLGDSDSGAVRRTLHVTLENKASCIIVSGSILQAAIREKLKKYIDIIPNIHKNFDIYRHKNKESFLFLLVPDDYRDRVLKEWKECNKAYTKKNNGENIIAFLENSNIGRFTEQELALGLLVDNKNVFEKLTVKNRGLEKLRGDLSKELIKTKITSRNDDKKVEGEIWTEHKVFKNAEIVKDSRCIEPLKSMFVKNKSIPCGGRWIIFEGGHGLPSGLDEAGSVISLSVPDYKNKISFYEKNLDVHFLYVFSCYGGGTHLVIPYLEPRGVFLEKNNFFIMHAGTSDNALSLAFDFFPKFFSYFFNFVEKTNFNLISKAKNLYKKCFHKPIRDIESFSSIIPFVRFPRMEKFIPINPWGDEVKLVNYAEVWAHAFANKNIIIEPKNFFVLISPTIIPQVMEIKNSKKLLSIYSIMPGNSVHFLAGINVIEKPIDLIEFITLRFLCLPETLSCSAQKIFVIKDLKFKQSKDSSFPIKSKKNFEIVELENVVIITPTKHSSDAKAFFYNKHDKKNYYISAGTCESYEKYKKKKIVHCDEKELWEELNDSFVPFEKIRKDFLLAGQDEYDFFRDIAKLKTKNLWLKDISTFDFVWNKIGFKRNKLDEIDVLTKEFEKKLLDPSVVKLRLSEAVGRNDIKMLKTLLTFYKNINAPVDEDLTLLHIAVLNFRFKVIEFLLSRNAIIDVKDSNKQTPLHYAVHHQIVEMASFLLKKGARADLIDGNGETPFHMAIKPIGIKSNVDKLIETFIQNGIPVDIKNKEGKTVYESADIKTKKFIDKLITKYRKNNVY